MSITGIKNVPTEMDLAYNPGSMGCTVNSNLGPLKTNGSSNCSTQKWETNVNCWKGRT
jgi:hypothetical protein